MTLSHLEIRLTRFFQRYSISCVRLAFFIIYLWFGALKVVGLSSVSPVAQHFAQLSLPFVTPALYTFLFGVFEIILALVLLLPRLIRLALPLLFLHLVTTLMPLILLPQETWSGFLTPTLAGQDVIKNVLILVASCLFVIDKLSTHSSIPGQQK